MKNRLRKGLIAAAMALPVAAAGLLVGPTASATSPIPATARAASTLPPAIFLTPHQDDETLSMGAAIKQHVDAGRTVYVLLLTDGGASGVCKTDYATRADCVAERDREFNAATTELGAIPVILPDRKLDGVKDLNDPNALTGAYVAAKIQEWEAKFPGASFKTMSEKDDHPDHAAAGRGLYAAYLWGYTDDARWYIKRYQQQSQAGSCTGEYNINSAATLYHPVGWKSVQEEFNWIFNTSSYPDKGAFSKVMTPAQRGLAGPGNDSLGNPETCWWPQITAVTGTTSKGTR